MIRHLFQIEIKMMRRFLLCPLPALLYITISTLSSTAAFLVVTGQQHRSSLLPLAAASPYLSANTVFLDISIQDTDIGRLVFALTIPSPLPNHAEHFLGLIRGDRRSITPTAHYEGCAFDFSPDFIEGESRYRWSHICRGRSLETVVVDPENQSQCVHSCYGGQYYGDQYFADQEDEDVFLAVAIAGPGRGSDRFSIIRVGESPQEWGERLLLNAGVIGRLVEGHDVLRILARQRVAPPTIRKAGVIIDTTKEQGDSS